MGMLLYDIRCGAQIGGSSNENIEAPETHLAIPGVPTPNAASLGTYANNVVGQFTGVPDINIPIYEINEGGFKLPISLSYNATGVKVADVASWVGTGWSLNAGGVITRNVMDNNDDYNFGGVAQNGYLYYNYKGTYAEISAAYANPTINEIGLYNDSVGLWNVNSLHLLRTEGCDTEPDMFYFNFNGHAGRFVFSQGTGNNTGQVAADQHQICSMPYTTLKFSYTLDNINELSYSGGWLRSFTIVDDEGNQYLFDKKELLQYRSDGTQFNNSSIPSTPPRAVTGGTYYYTAWYLSKITTVLGKEINFNYVTESYTQDLPISYSVRGFTIGTGIGCNGKYRNGTSVLDFTDNVVTNFNTGLRLSSIEGADFKVVFNANHDRLDLAGTKALTSIQIFSKDINGSSTFVKGFNLDYYYLTSPVDPDLIDSTTHGDPNKRLFLNTLTEQGTNNTTNPPYRFEYDNSYTLPSRFSPHQDFWGYFNNSSCKSLIPTVYIYPAETGSNRFSVYPKTGYTGTSFTLDGADRTTNAAAITAGTLKRINYPTGGYQQFDFEPNSFFYQNQNLIGGGIRLHKSTLYDGIDHANDVVDEYVYTRTSDPSKTSGVLFNLPVYAYAENFPNYWYQNGSNAGYFTPEFDPMTLDYYTHNLVITSAPNFTLSGYDGINVGYSEITKISAGNGYTVSSFSTPGRYGIADDIQGSGCSSITDGYCDGLFKAPVAHWYWARRCNDGSLDLPSSPDLTGIDFGSNAYPFAPRTNYDWNRGLLLSKKYYNNSGTIVKEALNTYGLFTGQNGAPTYVYGLRKSRMTNYHLYTSSCFWAVYGLARFDVVSEYPILTNTAKLLQQTVEKVYDQTNPTIYLADTVSYTYGPNHANPKKIVKLLSDGRYQEDYFNYSFDYSVNSSSATEPAYAGLLNLQSKHVNTLVEQYSGKRGITDITTKVTTGNLTTYKPQTPLPDKIFKLETSSPITNFSPTLFTNSAIVKNANFQLIGNCDDYDQNGNLWQVTKRGYAASSVLWGYNESVPVAEVRNAELDQIAYTSFEEDDQYQSNWNIGTGFTPSAKAKTGNNCYNLAVAGVGTAAYIPEGSYVLSFWGDNTTASTYNVQLFPAPGATGAGQQIQLVKQTNAATSGDLVYFEYAVYNPYSNATLVLNPANNSTPIYIDELRLYLANAAMKTYTYNKMIGVSSTCDEHNMIDKYEYDDLGRLILIRDEKGNIVKKINYGIQSVD